MSDERRQYSDDALLSALIDDELPPERAAELRARLAEEPALAARYEALRRADRRVRRAFASADPGPLPEAVLRLLRDAGERPAPARSAKKTVSLPAPRRFRPPPAALAAGIALFFLGFVLARVLLPQQPATPPGLALADAAGVVDEASPLYRVLENAPSSETVRLSGGLAATPRLTFERKGGGYCRLLDVAGASGANSALACRAGDTWRLRLATFAGGALASDNGYRLASSGRSPAVDRMIDDLIEGAPLGAEAEADLLRSGWRDRGDHTP